MCAVARSPARAVGFVLFHVIATAVPALLIALTTWQGAIRARRRRKDGVRVMCGSRFNAELLRLSGEVLPRRKPYISIDVEPTALVAY